MEAAVAGETYLEEARGLNEAVAILCKAKVGATLYAIGILAAHCLELALKAYLLRAGRAESELKDIGHDLTKAWENCKQSELPLGDLPYWVQVLNFAHSNPYFFRYPQANHNVAVPSTDDLSNDIQTVLDMVAAKMNNA
jgi:hypothetical protein